MALANMTVSTEKFKNCENIELAEVLYEQANLEVADQFGSVYSESGWVALITNDLGEFPDEAYIVQEDEDGYFTYEAFASEEMAREKFNTLCEEYEAE